MVEQLDLERTVDFKGVLDQDQTYLHLRAADIFLLNTGYEGLSHTILEAMTLGTPVITTNRGGNPELITNGKSGLLIEFNDKDGLCSAIQSLLDDPKLTSSVVHEAEMVVEKFNQEKMIKETKATLESRVPDVEHISNDG